MSQPESRIARKIRDELRSRGIFVFTVHGSEMMMGGLPDLIACRNGEFVGIEVKTQTGVVSPRQEYVHELIRAAGGQVIIARSVADVADL